MRRLYEMGRMWKNGRGMPCPYSGKNCMEPDEKKHRRRTVRLPEYDYASVGYYFVTVCAHQHRCVFGEIQNDEMQVNAVGQIVEACWREIPRHFAHSGLDVFIVMPNHVHGIVVINEMEAPSASMNKDQPDGRGTACRAPTREEFGKPVHGSLATIIRSFKSACTKQINVLRRTPGQSVWQRGFYDRVIRDEVELRAVREYIVYNPLKWDLDEEHPDRWKGE